jgi:hypothetical protein
MSMLLFMPWCRIDRPYQAGRVTLVPYDRGIGSNLSDSVQSTVHAILTAYKTIDGKPVDRAALLQYGDKQLVEDLTEKEIAHVRDIVTLVAFCGLATREYFNPLGNYCNSDCFSLFVQKFSDAEFTALRTRRREGHTLSGWPIKDISITVPAHCQTVSVVGISGTLLTALENYEAKDSNFNWARWQSALACFNQANTDADTVSYQVEWILMCSAFEHLLSAKSNARDVADKFSKALAINAPLAVRNARRRSSNRLDPDNAIHYEWMREFYRIRGDFAHGKLRTHQTAVWNEMEHLVLAAIAFPLVIKCLLAKSKNYKPTDEDQAQIAAFEEFADTPNFMDPPAEQRRSLDSSWKRVCAQHRSELTISKAVHAAWDTIIGDHIRGEASSEGEGQTGGDA